jgi:hypothetical protein
VSSTWIGSSEFLLTQGEPSESLEMHEAASVAFVHAIALARFHGSHEGFPHSSQQPLSGKLQTCALTDVIEINFSRTAISSDGAPNASGGLFGRFFVF